MLTRLAPVLVPLSFWAKEAVKAPAILPEKFKFRSAATAAELSVLPVAKKIRLLLALMPVEVGAVVVPKVVVAVVILVALGIEPVVSVAVPLKFDGHAVIEVN